MTLLSGINHAAVLTDDLERFVAFYTGVFDAEVIFEEDTPAFRHAMLRVGEVGVLHAVAQPGNPDGRGRPTMLGRGHLDHLGLHVADEASFEEVRDRLRRAGATDGQVYDLGPQVSLWFTDPDGMAGEVCWDCDRTLRGFHEPVPVERPA
jgi:catechol 2,3-dioxygenase-like lactoylglutathione lyase family enzyme